MSGCGTINISQYSVVSGIGNGNMKIQVGFDAFFQQAFFRIYFSFFK